MSTLSKKINDYIAQNRTIEIENHGKTHVIHGNANACVVEGKGCEYIEQTHADETITLYNLATCTAIRIK
ncbi:hypothetical protein ACD661_11420 [Legionella lytica]|uniref:Uncharacterized protein n=1 Tax=Legionella lytica TaxID=96232 RepID=A0ABW8D8X9_9GAMM